MFIGYLLTGPFQTSTIHDIKEANPKVVNYGKTDRL
jgi:hypothetical protein